MTWGLAIWTCKFVKLFHSLLAIGMRKTDPACMNTQKIFIPPTQDWLRLSLFKCPHPTFEGPKIMLGNSGAAAVKMTS